MGVVNEAEWVYVVLAYGLILKALSVSIERVWSSLLASRAMAIAASSVRLIVRLSGWDFISICVVV